MENYMYDIIVIGAGVVGCSIARELSRYQAKIAVIDKCEDVGEGTTKANSALIHAGFDAMTGTKKAKYNVRGNKMMDRISKELDFPFYRNGAYVLCDDEKKLDKLQELLERGKANGVERLEIISGDELRSREKNVSKNIVAALYAPDSGIVCPFNMTIAYAENACVNGAKFMLGVMVKKVIKKEDCYLIETDNGSFETRAVVNAAGVFADEIHNMVSKNKIKVTPKRGEYMLLDTTAANLVRSTMFQLPGEFGKGVLVTPTIHGNMLIGPTSTLANDKCDVTTSNEGYDYLKKRALSGISNIPFNEVITSFAGIRAHEEGNDFLIGEVKDSPLFFDAAGIESPGLSSAPAIAIDLSKMIARKLKLTKKIDFIKKRKGILLLKFLPLKTKAKLIKENPDYGEVVCRCCDVSKGEIIGIINRPIKAKSLDAVKRRLGAGMGRCQGGFCSPKVMEILANELGVSMSEITKKGGNSKIITSDRLS